MTTTTRMAILLLFPAIIGLLTAPTYTTATTIIFSDPFESIKGGDKLTDGDYTLSVGKDCSLALYKSESLIYSVESPIPSTSHCFIYLDGQGVLYVYPNDVRIAPLPLLGSPSSHGRYAFVLDGGKLNIYGPAIWSNGVGFNQSSTTLEQQQQQQQQHSMQAASANSPIIYSGNYFDASSSGADVVAAAYFGISVVFRANCTIAVLAEDGSIIWGSYTPTYKVRGQCQLQLRSDGELVIGDRVKYGNGVPTTIVYGVWRSGFSSKATKVYVCVLRYNGELVIYGLKDKIYGEKTIAEREIKMVTGA